MLEFLFDFLEKFRKDKVELSLEELVKGLIVTKQKDVFEEGPKEYIVLPVEFRKGRTVGIFSYKPNFFMKTRKIEIPIGLTFRESGKKDKFLEIEKNGYLKNSGRQKSIIYLSLTQSNSKIKLIKDLDIGGKTIEQEYLFNVLYLDYPSAPQLPFALYFLNSSREACCPYIEEDGELNRYVILQSLVTEEIEKEYIKLKRKPLFKKVTITSEKGIKGKLTEEDFKKLNDWANGKEN